MKLFVVIEGDNDWPEMQDPERLLMAYSDEDRAEYLKSCMELHCPQDKGPVFYYKIEEVPLAL